jgi:hypothetical protein
MKLKESINQEMGLLIEVNKSTHYVTVPIND